MKKENLILIGNGMAGVRTLEELLSLAPDKYNIIVYGAEPYTNYNRILLSSVLAGEKTIDDIVINDEQWYSNNHITLLKGKKITQIDRVHRKVIVDDGTKQNYDRLILASGSKPFVIPIPGADLRGVISFRDINDVNAMLEATIHHKNAVVIGGGLLGLEAANGLMKQGMNVTVVHLLDTLMERQLDKPAADLLRLSLEERGLQFRFDCQTDEILGEDHVTGLRFKDGTEIKTDLVVMAVGIRPNKELAESAGLHCEQGVLVSDTMQTFDPRIYAVGECVQHRGTTYGLVAPLFEQAKVCANHLAELGYASYEGSVTSTKLKVTGIDLFSAGNYLGDEETEDMIYTDTSLGVYKKLVIKDNRIDGAVLYGDTIDGSWYFQLMRDATDITDMRDNLLFGQAHIGDSGHGITSHTASLPDNAEICGCNGICKGDIVKAITSKGLFTLDDVRAHTKASSSCGSCTGLVEELLASTVGADFTQTKNKPVCTCTAFTHEEIRKGITEHHLKTINDVRNFFEWKNTDGCHICRPALNYYLICAWPGIYEDDPQSRFINERAHANIQKDGTYSVVPRIFGGETSPQQLRAMADVAEKYQIPTVKITGGQRIDLLGVKKEDLPKVWGDLSRAGFVSGHAYGKALRTVKTCVGSEWCRFGTQDSTTMGINLEKMSWGAWTPHKFKAAVSGCPRNCAEATIKDFGVVAVDSGWELHVGGNGGVKVRATDLLCKVETMEEVLEYCAAYMQLYREEARYLERTAPWLERVGLSYVKQRLIDDPTGRVELAGRFRESQKYAQVDPWAAHANSMDNKEFIPIKEISAKEINDAVEA